MKGPSCIIDPPSPYAARAELWAFLCRLRDFDQDDPAVQNARRQVLAYLVVENRHEPESD